MPDHKDGLCAAHLPNRGSITISGDDRYTFLQGLITQDLETLDQHPLVYACLLTAQGKFLHDFFIHTVDEKLIIDCEGGARTHDLFRRLSMYKLRSNIEITMAENTPVWQIFSSSGEQGILPSSSSPALKDPRHHNCGWKYYKTTEPENCTIVSFDEWDHHRIHLTIPDGSRDLIPEKSFIHEGRLDELNAVSYTKGCYVGQELVSRMHHRGLSKKHLQCVNLNAVPDGAELRSSCRDIGLAVVKIKT